MHRQGFVYILCVCVCVCVLGGGREMAGLFVGMSMKVYFRGHTQFADILSICGWGGGDPSPE